MQNTTHRVVGVALGLFLAVSLLAEARARAAEACGEVPQTVLLLDRSGSMKETVNGKTKAAIANAAINGVLNKFAGKIAFGMALFPQWPHQKDCSTAAVNVLPNLQSGNGIRSLLNAIDSKGNTPIAASLDAVGAHLKTLGNKPRYVILVSDGKETCLEPPAPLTMGGSCAWENGTNYRRCGGCGWQFCLKSGTWSGACEAKPDMFGCPMGQTCQSNATCAGPAGGVFSAEEAATRLNGWGIKTYVIGFGAQVDADVLNAVAKAGGTNSFHQATDQAQLDAVLGQIAETINCCGNGALDPGELCDSGIAANQPGACPASCDDQDQCTTDTLVGQGCQLTCLHQNTCPQVSCGDGKLDAGELCDPGIPAGQPGACPTTCDDGDSCTKDVPQGTACNLTCANTPMQPNPVQQDGCCPAGLTEQQDADCLPPCGPDRHENCIDTCADVTCPVGQVCSAGMCVADTSLGDYAGGGCDCQAGPGLPGSSALLLCGLLLGLAFVTRRRG